MVSLTHLGVFVAGVAGFALLSSWLSRSGTVLGWNVLVMAVSFIALKLLWGAVASS